MSHEPPLGSHVTHDNPTLDQRELSEQLAAMIRKGIEEARLDGRSSKGTLLLDQATQTTVPFG
jgi:hypothetical protein